MAANDIKAVKPSTLDTAQSDTIQDTKPAENLCAISTLGTAEATIKDATIQGSLHHQVTRSTQIDTVSEMSE